MSEQDKREQRLVLLEDHIGEHLLASEATGELRAAPSFGRPLDLGDGYDETPAELRMGMKVLKDAGVLPPEVEMMQRIAVVQQQADAAPDESEARALRQRLAEMRQHLALRLEQLRVNRSL